MANSVDPDEGSYEPSHLDLCCLQKSIIIACGSERVKIIAGIKLIRRIILGSYDIEGVCSETTYCDKSQFDSIDNCVGLYLNIFT